MKTLLTTENTSSIELINSEYFNNSVDFSNYGTVADITKFVNKGIFYISLTVKNADNITLLLFDNLSLTRIKVREGVNHIYTEIKSNSWGFLLIPNDVNVNLLSTVEIIKISPIITPPFPVNAWTIGDVTIDVLNANCILSTNRGRSISIVSEVLFNDKNYLREFGVEASAVEVNNLPNGVYQCDVKRSIYDVNNNDSLYIYNGRNFSKISDTLVEQKTVEFEVLYGYIDLIAVDINKTSGVTEFVISNVKRLRDLDYFVPQKMSLIPDSQLGRVISDKSGIIISTGTGSRAISSIIDSLNLSTDFSFPNSDDKTFTEGSYAVWNLEDGKYQINWEFSTKEAVNKDSVYIYDGEQFTLLDNTNNEYLIDLQSQELVIIVLDEKDKKGTTQVKITNILLVGEIDNSSDNLVNTGNNEEINFHLGGDITAYHKTLILSENKQLNLTTVGVLTINFSQNNTLVYTVSTNEIYGILLAGEYQLSLYIDPLYNDPNIENDYTLNLMFGDAPNPIPEGYLTIGNNQGTNDIINPINQEINFTFGGDITAYRNILTLTENKELTVSIDKPVIVEISQSNAVIYSQEYTTELNINLLAGEYQLNLFTESSIEEDYLLILNSR